MSVLRRTPVLVEVIALAGAIAIAWWLGSHATSAWLARVAALHLKAPSAVAVHGAARSACLYFTVGTAALIGARLWMARRIGESTVHVPWLLPAAAAASLLGLAFHLATVETSHGAALLPSAAGFAQGYLIGCIAGAAVLVAPVDIAELASRARVGIAIAIGAIFAALAVVGSGPAGSGTRINLGPIQPIELVKPLTVLFLAAYLGARAPKLRWQRARFLGLRWPRVELLVPALGVLVLIVSGLRVIGDLGPVLLLAFVFLGMFFVASRATGWVIVALALVAGLLLILAIAPGMAGGGTVKTRLLMWQAPWTNGLSNGSQLAEGLWAIAAGGSHGQGLAQALVPLPPAGKTDLAMAVMAEQLGAFGVLAYHVALGAIVLGALRVAARSRTAERTLIASGIGILVLAQWMVIEAGTLGHLPLTGIVWPFLSAGRSSMAVFLVIVAVVVRLSLDARPRAASAELEELHGAARGARWFAVVAIAIAFVASLGAAIVDRTATLSRGIVMRLADGTRIHRQNPRHVALAERLRRGSILDRNGEPIAFTDQTGRTYPLKSALGTLVGTSPSPVLLPPWALERRFEDKLRGYPERIGGPAGLPWPDLRSFVPLLDLDGAARERAFAARDGNIGARSVRVSLDSKLQAQAAKLAQAAVARGKLAVAAVVIDVDTGEVLARVQAPDYDPGARDVLASTDKKFRGTYGGWPDKTGLQGMFQSGSIGKLFTAFAALREGAGGARYECRETDLQGPLFMAKGWPKPIHDHSGDQPHGSPDLVQAIAVSCNVYFAQLGLALGPEPMRALHAAGLEVGYGGALDPGAPGTRQLASTAFGQGIMVMNTMQAARMVAAIANGGTYTKCPPAMELGATCEKHSLIADPAALAPLVAGMRRVMTAGTGARLTAPAGVRVYGKTGTADVRGFLGEEPWGIARAQLAAPHSWFVAFAEPDSTEEGAATAPGRLAIAVVVPRGGTGASAAGPLAMQILGAAHELGYLR
jgi:cell division protein FtsW (lipid II flippase)